MPPADARPGTGAPLSLRAVSKRYGETLALDGLELALDSGRTTVLLGPSGCGKSTALRTMIGLVTPDAGEVCFEGRPAAPSQLPAMRRKIGYVIQDGGLFPHLTARENVVLAARWLGWDGERIDRRLAALEGLTHFPRDGWERYPLELSGGQRQRVGLMRALMLEPEILLLDEPLGALDPMIRSELQTELREIFRTLGKTVALVTHDLNEAAFLGDVIVLMRDGRVVQRGVFRDFVERPADPFVTRFVRAQRPFLADGAS